MVVSVVLVGLLMLFCSVVHGCCGHGFVHNAMLILLWVLLRGL